MTVDERLVVDLSEIQAIEVACEKCQTTICYRPQNWKPDQMECPGCGQELWFSGTAELQNMKQLAGALRAILGRPGEPGKPGVRLRLAWPVRRSLLTAE